MGVVGEWPAPLSCLCSGAGVLLCRSCRRCCGGARRGHRGPCLGLLMCTRSAPAGGARQEDVPASARRVLECVRPPGRGHGRAGRAALARTARLLRARYACRGRRGGPGPARRRRGRRPRGRRRRTDSLAATWASSLPSIKRSSTSGEAGISWRMARARRMALAGWRRVPGGARRAARRGRSGRAQLVRGVGDERGLAGELNSTLAAMSSNARAIAESSRLAGMGARDARSPAAMRRGGGDLRTGRNPSRVRRGPTATATSTGSAPPRKERQQCAQRRIGLPVGVLSWSASATGAAEVARRPWPTTGRG